MKSKQNIDELKKSRALNTDDENDSKLFQRCFDVLVTGEINGTLNDLFDPEMSDVFHRISGHPVVVNYLPDTRAHAANG